VRWLRFPRVVGVAVVAYLILVTGYYAFETTRRSQFIADASRTTGIVIALEPRPLPGTTRVHTIGDEVPLAPEVRYEVGGRTYLYTPAHGMMGSPVRVGDQIEVLYDPDDPSRARLRSEGQVLLPLITAGFGTLTVGVVALLVLTRHRGEGGRRPASHPAPVAEPSPVAGP
jgi:hypothetical protein